MLAKITVADYMATRMVTLAKDTNVIDAIKSMLDHKITKTAAQPPLSLVIPV